MKKYKLTDESIQIGNHTLYRILALKSFGNVTKGDLGGFIEKESNLSHEGNCWVYGNAWVSGNARVYGNAQVSDRAWVHGNAQVSGDALVYGNARVSDRAWVFGDAQVYGNAEVSGDARVYEWARINTLKWFEDNITFSLDDILETLRDPKYQALLLGIPELSIFTEYNLRTSRKG